MKTLRRFLRRLTGWATARRDEERLQTEVEDHIAFETSEGVRAGLTPVEARRQAILKFGAVEAIKESYRDQRGIPFLETLFQDTRHALRRLRMSPAFTITTVLTLGLGIGATTSIFTLVYGVILKSLAVAKPSELYRLGKQSRCCYWGGYTQADEFSIVSYDLYKYLRDHTKGFAELAAFASSESSYGVKRAGTGDAAQVLPGEFVSGNYFSMFGVLPYAGRMFTAEDDRRGAAPVAVMSYRLWQQRYGADPSVLGAVFNLNGTPYTVVGITPPAYFGDTLRDTPPDFYLPLITEDDDIKRPDTHWLNLIGRIQPGVTPQSIEAQMRVELKQWLYAHWGEMSPNDRTKIPEQTLYLRPGGSGITSMREDYEHWLGILMIASGFVLVIVCANVANLMLVRGMERRRQTSLTMALGARPSRIVRQAFTESIWLSLFGGASGIACAFVTTRAILYFAFPPVPGMARIPISALPSVPVLLFTLVVSVITGVAFGIAPAWMATRTDPMEALRGAGRSTGRTGSFTRKTLVICQAALSLVLLSSAGLLTAALSKLEHQDFGFEQDRRTVVRFNPSFAGYSGNQLTPLYQRIHDTLAAIPGVSSVALCITSPQGGDTWSGGVWVDGRPSPGPNDDIDSFWERVTNDFFKAVGTPIIRGRALDERDTAGSQHVAVINEAFARKFFKDADPIGKHFGTLGEKSRRAIEIVGIVRDARLLPFGFDKPIGPFFFVPESQHDFQPNAPSVDGNPGSHYMHDIVIVSKPGASVSDFQVRQAMASLDPNLAIRSIRTLREQVAAQFTQQRLIARLTSFFGLLSLILASIGLYGVTAYNAGQRTGEIGVRMALGADRGQVVRLVLRGAVGLVAVGLLIGLPLTLAAGRFLGAQLYGFSPYDPWVTLLAALALGFTALVASFVPAFRASLISPVDALRAE